LKLDQPTLALICDLISQGESFDGAAKICGCTRRSIYNYIDNSRRAQATDDLVIGEVAVTETLALPKYSHNVTHTTKRAIFSPYYIRWRGQTGWFHDFIQQAKSPWKIDPETRDCTDAELEALGYRDRYLRNEAGEKIPWDEPPEAMADIDDLRSLAHAEPAREKQRPTHPVEIMRASDRPSDPIERVTALPVEKSVAQREREHPRRWDQEIPPLHTSPRPSYARPTPLDSYSATGAGEPPDIGRITVATQSYSRAEVLKHGPLSLRDAQGRPLK